MQKIHIKPHHEMCVCYEQMRQRSATMGDRMQRSNHIIMDNCCENSNNSEISLINEPELPLPAE